MSGVGRIFVAKAFRVFVFGFVTIITPIYFDQLGFPPLYVGAILAVIIAGNAASNIIITWFGDRLGRRNTLLLFSLLMFSSGLILFSTTYPPLMLLAVFIGNISTTGTEAGPFQSVETGVLPMLVKKERVSRAYGFYNLVGYGAASFGALMASLPGYYEDGLQVIRSLFLLYGMAGLLLAFLYRGLGGIETSDLRQEERGPRLRLTGQAQGDLAKLSALFSIDAFGGGFVTQSILAYWFFLAYGVTLAGLGTIFLVVNVVTALSILGASFLAEKIGNLRTMVYTHLLSNVFLMMIPLAGSLAGALLFLVLRQSVSQMDVPARQAFIASVFNERDRISAIAITNTLRSVSNIFGAPLSGFAFGAGLSSLPILAGGFAKILYDAVIFVTYRGRAR